MLIIKDDGDTMFSNRKSGYELVDGSSASSPFFGKPKIGRYIPKVYRDTYVYNHETGERDGVVNSGYVKRSFFDRLFNRNSYTIADPETCQTVGDYWHRRVLMKEAESARASGDPLYLEWRIGNIQDNLQLINLSEPDPVMRQIQSTKAQEEIDIFADALRTTQVYRQYR